ncbi:hypothetical protein M3936_23510 [Sutcliffiella horikoshii]|uniref:hypothetical protein n=1 Tax=Sutcliffiella horikoshii TaxID=79883 RepID=UPI00203B8563|nr:hypothetical protein [Sutcliffiella horikoshii]MCM3620526.1 hypothetical protein [Sutcliffiella horikoshii]
MFKVFIKTIIFLGLISLLAACNSKADLSDYLDVQFSGYDSIGTADYTIDESKLVKDVFDVSENSFFNIDAKTFTEIEDMLSSISVNMSKDENLSNGEEITLSLKIDKEKTNKLKTKDNIKVTVSGLEKPKELSDDEIEKRVVVNYTGASGKGNAQIETTFDGDLRNLSFVTNQDGGIKNGDTITVKMSDESKDELANLGYILSGKGQATFVASNLTAVAEKHTDIINLKDIERLISEGINREYQDSDWGFYKYEVIKEHSFYRQFKRDDDEPSDWFTSSPSNGTLVNLYTIKKYDDKGSLEDKFTTVFGFTDIILDENNKASLVDLNHYSYTYDDTYSLESIVKLMEGYGYHSAE